jgi:hypothetical protein
MDQNRFAVLTHSMTRIPSRRDVLRGLVAAGLGLQAAPRPDVAAAKKRKKVRFNAFNCVSVGGFCKNAGQCCSGICEGKKGKRKCRAHDTGGCQPGGRDTICSASGTDIPCTTSTGAEVGQCNTTTGNAGFCAAAGSCFACTKDAQCQERYGQPEAACIRCDKCPQTGGTSCAEG